MVEGDQACDTQTERREEKGDLQNAGSDPDEGCRCLANQQQVVPTSPPLTAAAKHNSR